MTGRAWPDVSQKKTEIASVFAFPNKVDILDLHLIDILYFIFALCTLSYIVLQLLHNNFPRDE